MKNVQIIETSTYWCTIRFSTEVAHTTLCTVYLPPNLDFGHYMPLLENSIVECQQKFKKDIFLIVGDFNAKIGELNQDDNDLLINTKLHGNRTTSDNKEDKKGRDLASTLNTLGFYVLNGRTISDYPAQYTYISETGKSIVDLVWVNAEALQLICDFEVLDFHPSDHFPTRTILMKDKRKEEQLIQELPRIKWNELQAIKYMELLQNQLPNPFERDIHEMYADITEHITTAADALGMYKKNSSHKNYHLNLLNWFNADCKQARKRLKRKYRKAKKKKFSQPYLSEYLNEKKIYKNLIKTCKTLRQKEIQKSIDDTKKPLDFWKTIKNLQYKKTINDLDITTWTTYYKKQYSTSTEENFTILNQIDHYLDAPITYEELVGNINKMKNKKTPGIDGTPIECIKNLPPNWTMFLLKLYNKI